LEDAVVEDQVDKEVLVADEDPLLPRLETEAASQLQQESLHPVEQGVFELRFAHHLGRLDAKKLEDVRVADHQGRAVGLGALPNLLQKLGSVSRQRRPLEGQRSDLALQLANGPLATD